MVCEAIGTGVAGDDFDIIRLNAIGASEFSQRGVGKTQDPLPFDYSLMVIWNADYPGIFMERSQSSDQAGLGATTPCAVHDVVEMDAE